MVHYVTELRNSLFLHTHFQVASLQTAHKEVHPAGQGKQG